VITVAGWVAAVVLVLFVALLACGMWAIRYHDRMFPKGFDRTGWNPNSENVGWLMTKFTWLSGGRGS
jgi:hypothetical protein